VLYDVLGEAVGERQEVSLGALDLSAVIPMLGFLLGALALRTQPFAIGLWTKTLLLAGKSTSNPAVMFRLFLLLRLLVATGILCLVKGTFDAVTVVPASDGWDKCVERLGDARFDIVKPGGVLRATRNGTRFCADMFVSGHTNSAALFSLASYKLAEHTTAASPPQLRRRVLVGVAVVCVGCLATEFVLVTLSKFHYTVDILASLLLVALFWDSGTIDGIAGDWVEGYRWGGKSWGHLVGWSWLRLCGVRRSDVPEPEGEAAAGVHPWRCRSLL
jgi:hypothetical protein